jgi:hypothetical protein
MFDRNYEKIQLQCMHEMQISLCMDGMPIYEISLIVDMVPEILHCSSRTYGVRYYRTQDIEFSLGFVYATQYNNDPIDHW